MRALALWLCVATSWALGATTTIQVSDKATGDRVLLRDWRQTENRGGTFFITVDNKKRK